MALREAVAAAARYRGIAAGERRAQRRTRLIAAAADVYGERGYRNATVRTICRRAQLTERYFYEAFASSEDLLLEVARTLADQTLARMREMRDATGGDRDAKTLRMLTSYFRLQRDEPLKARTFTLEFRGISAAADGEFERILDRFAELVVETRDPDGAGPAAASRLLRRGIVGGILHIAVSWIERRYDDSLEAVALAALQLCRVADPGASPLDI